MPLRFFLALISVLFATGLPHDFGFAFPHGTVIVQETSGESRCGGFTGHNLVCSNTRQPLFAKRNMPTRLAARDGAKTRPRMMVTPDTSNKQNSTEEEVRLLEQFGASLPKRFYVSNFTGAMGRVVKNRMPRAFPSLPKLPNASSSIFETARNTTEANDDSGYFPNVGSLWKGMTNWTNSIPSFPSRKSRERIPVKSLEELEFWLKQGVSVHRLDIRGRSQPWRQNEKGELVEALPESQGPDEDRLGRADGRERQLQHPVLRAIWKRVRENSKPGQRKDNFKIALAIEGGGLRGSVTAGMASAIMHLGLGDAFDMVLGSSAGSIIGTYLVARAPPSMTYQFFCNHLTTSREKLNGSTWLDMGRLVDLFTPDSIPRPRRQKDQIPMMALDYPMKTIMQELLPVNWETFQKNDRHQPMKVVASGLFSKGPVVLGSEEGSFTDLASLCECVKASCMLPGVAGVQPPWLRGSAAVTSPEKLKRGQQEWVEQEMQRSVLFKARDVFLQQLGERVRKKVEAQGDDRAAGVNGISRSGMQRALSDLGIKPTEEELDKIFVAADLNANGQIELDEFNEMILAMLRNSDLEEWFQPMEGIEPMVDALVFEPIPYRSAADYGCTHVLVLRSYPDGKLLPRSLLGLFERLVAPKCLDPFPEVKSHLTSGGHSVVYAEDILKLNSAVARPSEDIDEIQVDDARDVGRQLAAKTSKWLGLPGLVKNEREQARREPYLFAISPLDTDGEALSSLELNRDALLRGIIQGFARAYDLLVPDECPAGGDQVAADVYLPIHYKFLKQLAKSGNLEKTYKYQRSLFFNLPSLRQDATRGKATPKLSLMGKRVPEAWSEGDEYVMSEGSMFDRNELVVMTGTDGSLRFGVVMGCKDGECILEYGEPDSRDQSPLFRMERVEYVGKIMADMSELKALTVDGPKKTFTGTSMKFVSNLLQRMKKDNDRARVPREDAGKEKVGKRGRVARLRNAQAGVQQSRSSGVDGDGI